MIFKVELNFARSEFVSNAKPIEYPTTPEKDEVADVDFIAVSDKQKKVDAENSAVINTYTTKYGVSMYPVISQTVHLVSYYKFHKQRTKFRNKLQKNKTKKR